MEEKKKKIISISKKGIRTKTFNLRRIKERIGFTPKGREREGEKQKLELPLSTWHIFLIIILISLSVIFPFILNRESKLYLFTIFSFIFYSSIHIYGIIKGLFKDERANGFFRSVRAIDFWVHCIGGFAFYLAFLLLFKVTPEWTILITFLAGILFEIVEWLFEIINIAYNKRFKPEGEEGYAKYISEPKGNILQDLIMNMVGALTSYVIAISFS